MENNINKDKNKKFAFWFAGICVVVFLIQLIIPGFTESFMLTSSALTEPWQFLTSVFLHGGIVHLLYNMFALVLFGFILESLIGSKRFFFLYIAGGIIANIISFYWYPNSLGASGAIMAVLGCLAVLRPGMTVWAFNIPMPMAVAAVVWAGGAVLGVFGLGDQGVGHLAHLSGIVVGLIYGFYLRLRLKKNHSIIFERRVHIAEGDMRSWEDDYMR